MVETGVLGLFLIIFILSFLVCALGTMVGLGGGIFIVPLLVIAFKFPIEMAVGATAIALFPSSLMSTIFNLIRKSVDIKLAICLEIPTMIGAALGAYLTSIIPSAPLEFIFGFFLIFLGFKTASSSSKEKGLLGRLVEWLNNLKPQLIKGHYNVSLPSASFFGIVAGMVAGLFGIGGGVIKTPIMLNVFKVPVKVATSTSLFMITFTSMSAGYTHYKLGHIDLKILIPVVTGFVSGAIGGNLLGVRLKDESIKKLIAGSIGLAGIAVITHRTFSLWAS